MTSRFVPVVCLIAVVTAPVSAQVSPEPALARTDFRNIYISRALQEAFAALLERSITIRHQCDTIAASGTMHVVLRLTASPPTVATRAQTTMRRYTSGLVMAVVEIPAGAEYVELIAHELEHIVEQIEGLDLKARAEDGSGGVTMIRRGIYETTRAQEAGRAAVHEVYGRPDAAVSAMRRAFARAWRMLNAE